MLLLRACSTRTGRLSSEYCSIVCYSHLQETRKGKNELRTGETPDCDGISLLLRITLHSFFFPNALLERETTRNAGKSNGDSHICFTTLKSDVARVTEGLAVLPFGSQQHEFDQVCGSIHSFQWTSHDQFG